jgi:very-short-patch-repair endonuclease
MPESNKSSWNKGIPWSEEHKKKLRSAHLGKKMPNRKLISLEDRKKLSLAHKGQKPWNTGKGGTYKLSDETKSKMIISAKNRKLPEDFRQRCMEGARNRKSPSFITDEHRRKNREAQIAYRSKMGFQKRVIGKDETYVLDKIENTIGFKILRQYHVAGYFLDGYCPALNLAIEVDETYHNKKEQLRKDNYREQQIKNELNCGFLRIPLYMRGD